MLASSLLVASGRPFVHLFIPSRRPQVLKVINRSAFDLQQVFNTLVEAGTQLCGADMGIPRRRVGDTYPLAPAGPPTFVLPLKAAMMLRSANDREVPEPDSCRATMPPGRELRLSLAISPGRRTNAASSYPPATVRSRRAVSQTERARSTDKGSASHTLAGRNS